MTPKTEWQVAELWVAKRDSESGCADIRVGPKCSLVAHQRPRLVNNTHSMEVRECLASYIPWLWDSEFVSIPHVDGEGHPIPDYVYRALMLMGAGDGDGVLVATASGEKSGNYVKLSRQAHERLAEAFGPTDGVKFLQTIGLLFSTMTPGTARVVKAHIVWGDDDGRDGNGMAPKGAVPCSVQIRGMVLKGDGAVSLEEIVDWSVFGTNPSKLVKGIVSPTSPDGEWYIHHSQLKGMWTGDEDEVTLLILVNEGVASERIIHTPSGATLIRTAKSWMSAEVTALFKNTRSVRRACALRVRDEVYGLVSLLQPDHRVELLRRLGGLSTDTEGNLLPSEHAAIEALRTPIPWCVELEKLLGRFTVPEIVEIAHGAGVRVINTLAVISDSEGAAPLSLEEVRKRLIQGKKVWAAYRVPVNESAAVQFFAKNPYKRGVGAVVTQAAMLGMAGDADGDRVFIVGFEDAKNVFKFLDFGVCGTAKPAKSPKEGFNPKSGREVMAYWMSLLPAHPLVGQATLLGWRALRDGRIEDASLALRVANAAPMLAKWDVDVDGVPLTEVVATLSKRERELFKDKMVPPLGWREFKEFAHGLSSVRELAGWHQDHPESVLDVCSNAAAYAVRKWSKTHPKTTLGVEGLVKVVFTHAGVDELPVPGWVMGEVASIRDEWRAYWRAHRKEDGTLDDLPHGEIFERVHAWGAVAEPIVLEALLCSQGGPKETMALKWAAVLDTHRGVEVLGLHPDVERALAAENALRACHEAHHARRAPTLTVSLEKETGEE